MRVVVTVVDDATGEHSDVLVDAAGQTPMRTVVDALVRRTGGRPVPEGAPDGDVPFARSGLVDGAVLHVGGVERPQPEHGIAHLLVVGGVDAGRVRRLSPGTVRIALADDGSAAVGAATDERAGLEARTAFDGSVTVRLTPTEDDGDRPTDRPHPDARGRAGHRGVARLAGRRPRAPR